MSATEIIEEIKKLPREEQQKIAVFFGEVQKQSANKTEAGVSEQFKRMADEVFRTNDELFRKLAQ
jgi:hypothetical protein